MSEEMQAALVIIKPDGLVKSLTGNIIAKLSELKMRIIAAKIVRVTEGLAKQHYSKHQDREFFQELIHYLTGKFHTNRVLALVYYGPNAINKLRNLVGDKNPEQAAPETIRGKYGRIHSQTQVFENVIHVSDEIDEAEREIKLWFDPDEIVTDIFPTKTVKKETEIIEWS